MTRERLVVHELVIFLFVTLTTPVTLMLLARATLFRDRVEGNAGVPQRPEKTETSASPRAQTGP